MSDWPILSTLIFFPLVGVLIVSCMNDKTETDKHNIFLVTILTSLFVLALAVFAYLSYDAANPTFQLQEKISWLGVGLSYHLGIDSISGVFIILTTILLPLSILASWSSLKERRKSYLICLLLLESLLLGAFCSLNILLFYLFFEASLIPIFILIGVWGGKYRVQASYKFCLYNFVASIFFLLSIMSIYSLAHTLDMVDLLKQNFSAKTQYLLWCGFFVAFAVKIPIWPLHSFLRDVYVEAPNAVSALLSGIVLKLAGYGLLRFSLPLFPEASAYFAPVVTWCSVIAIIYCSLVALVQTDIKRLLAYSSVAHMGYVLIGIFALNKLAVTGAVFQMLSHGILSASMFFCVGALYQRVHCKQIMSYGGLATNMPSYAVYFLIFILVNIGLPGTSGFIGEFVPLVGAFKTNKLAIIIASFGVVLSASYSLLLYKRIMFGPLVKEKLKHIEDLSIREKIIFMPLALATIFLGIFPMTIINCFSTNIDALISRLH